MEGFLFQATIYLGAAVLAVPLAGRLGLGSVLGYLIAGILIGPVLGLVGAETRDLQHFAEFGVVMMLFIVGLELDPRALWDMRHRLLGLGGLQITLTAALITALGTLAGLPVNTALVVGMIFALSSTAIVVQTLTEKTLLHQPGGRSAFSVLLAQDIAVVPMLALIPLLALADPGTGGGSSHDTGAPETLIATLPGWAAGLVTLGAVALVILAGHFLTGPLFRFVARARLREVFTAATLLLVIGIALLMTWVGLSPALGTFLAGVVLANSEFRHELHSDLEPFKGLLLGLFFITVGAGIDFTLLSGDFVRIIGLTLGVMAVKLAVLLVLSLLFAIRGRDRWLFALGLAQAGEFGFVLLAHAVRTGALSVELEKTLLLVVALSMLLTPALFILYDLISRRHHREAPDVAPDSIDETHPIIIAGIGRFGQVVNRMVGMNGLKTTVLDHDIETIRMQRKLGIKSFFGDPTRPELLEAAGLREAEVLVVAVDDPEAVLKMVRHARRACPDLHIIARARDRAQVYRLYRAGADQIVRETFDSSVRAAKYVLKKAGLPAHEVEQAASDFYDLDREIMKEMAELWDPDIPILKNEAFLARARQLNSALVTAIGRPEELAKEAGERPGEEKDPG